jgi:starvation-inducible DNA-binding protein
MTELEAVLNIVLANKFVMYFKAHTYHWNTEGIEFSQLHSFFGGIYEDVYESVDDAAENLRKLGAYAPVSLTAMYAHKTIDEDDKKPDSAQGMLLNLSEANDKVIESLNKLFAVANAQNKQGLVNWVAGRLDIHEKHGWMIKAHLKG